MDNLACHKRAGVAEAIEGDGARLEVPPAYSPDPNPIEQAFAGLEALLRKAKERTVEGAVAGSWAGCSTSSAPRGGAPPTSGIADTVLHQPGNRSGNLAPARSSGPFCIQWEALMP